MSTYYELMILLRRDKEKRSDDDFENGMELDNLALN